MSGRSDEARIVLSFTPRKAKTLHGLYDVACAKGCTHLVFEGRLFDIGYAKYLLEYLDKKFSVR